MTNSKRKGVVLILVLTLLALIGIQTTVLTMGSSQMLFRTNTDVLNAADRNLTASTTAWLQLNSDKIAKDQTISLDTAAVKNQTKKCTVQIQKTSTDYTISTFSQTGTTTKKALYHWTAQ